MALGIAAADWNVVLVDVSEEGLRSVEDQLLSEGHTEFLTISADICAQDDVERIHAAVKRRFGRLDVLVNNAGYGNVNSVEDTGLDDFRRQIETNLFGTVILTKAAIPIMREQRSGHFIQFSSVGGRVGAPGRGRRPANGGGGTGIALPAFPAQP